MLIQRILTAALILPLFLAAMFLLPQIAWGAVMLAVVTLASLEWARLASLSLQGTILFASAVVLGCASIGFHALPHAGLILLGGAMVFWTMIAPRWIFRTSAVSPLASAIVGWLVLVSAWQAVFLLQVTPVRLLALLGVVWIADTAAYFAGRRFGRHKLAPTVSPGKTWEGVLGAGIAVGVYYWLLWWVIAPGSLTATPALDGMLVAAMLVLSVEGDLFESWMKRRAGVKDSGTVLPGHGGVLDRIDGVIAALPLAASLPLLARG